MGGVSFKEDKTWKFSLLLLLAMNYLDHGDNLSSFNETVKY